MKRNQEYCLLLQIHHSSFIIHHSFFCLLLPVLGKEPVRSTWDSSSRLTSSSPQPGLSFNLLAARKSRWISARAWKLSKGAATGAKSGNICTQGTGCSGDRELFDFMGITQNAAGDALITYTLVPQAGTGLIRVVKQTGGTTIN